MDPWRQFKALEPPAPTPEPDTGLSTVDWLSVLSDGTVAFATVVLVAVTIAYVVLTSRVAAATTESVTVAREALLANREDQDRTFKEMRRQHRDQIHRMDKQHQAMLAQLLESIAPDVELKADVAAPIEWEVHFAGIPEREECGRHHPDTSLFDCTSRMKDPLRS